MLHDEMGVNCDCSFWNYNRHQIRLPQIRSSHHHTQRGWYCSCIRTKFVQYQKMVRSTTPVERQYSKIPKHLALMNYPLYIPLTYATPPPPLQTPSPWKVRPLPFAKLHLNDTADDATHDQVQIIIVFLPWPACEIEQHLGSGHIWTISRRCARDHLVDIFWEKNGLFVSKMSYGMSRFVKVSPKALQWILNRSPSSALISSLKSTTGSSTEVAILIWCCIFLGGGSKWNDQSNTDASNAKVGQTSPVCVDWVRVRIWNGMINEQSWRSEPSS